MAYFMINNIDFSPYVSGLKISKAATYTAQTNAAGNSVVDYINSKRTIEATIIPLDDAAMLSLITEINKFSVQISFRNPSTNDMETIAAIIPADDIEYYTIQAKKVMYKAVTLTFTEL